MINRNSLINYHRTLNDLFEEEIKQNKKIQRIIFSSLRTIYTLAYIYFIFLAFLMFAFAKSSFMCIIHNLFHFHLPTNCSLPLSREIGWFWNIPDNYIYHLYMFYETSTMAFAVLIPSGVDSAFGLYVYQFSSILRAMMFALTDPLSTEKFSDLLRMCAVKHQKLLQCRNILEHVYRPIVFWHIVTNAVLLCIMIYDLTSVRKHINAKYWNV